MLMWKRSDLVKRPTQVPSESSCSRAKFVAVFISRSLSRGRMGWMGGKRVVD